MTKILFTNTNCSWNKGSASQLISASKILKRFVSDADFTLLSHRFELDSNKCRVHNIKVVGFGVRRPHREFLRYYMLWYIFSLSRCALWAILHKIGLNANSLTNTEVLREYAEADVVIDLSGDSFSDSKGGHSIRNSLNILMGILLGKPIVFYSQSIGPFKSLTIALAKLCLNRADLIIVREDVTKKYLETIGVKRPPIHLTADTAFFLETAPPERVGSILLQEGISKDNEPLVGISTSGTIARVCELHSSGHDTKYVTLMAKAIDYSIEKLNAKVILVPHVFLESSYDDRFVAKRILQFVKNKEAARLIANEYTPEELRGVIGKCDLFIGARMHANISAISMHVPTIAIAWSHKYYGIMRTLGQEKYVCDIRTMTFDELASKMDDAWSNREEITKTLINKASLQRELALSCGELVKNLLISVKKA